MKKLAFLLILIFTPVIYAQEVSFSQPMVIVNGEGVIKVIPDQVIISAGIEHEGENVQDVKNITDTAVHNILQYLKSNGVPEKNIRTNYVNLNKNYNYSEKVYTYISSQTISIKLEDLDKYETIMAGLLEAGLNRIHGIHFESSQLEQHKAEARKKAVINARQKATEYAGALDQGIGRAISINEKQFNAGIPPMYRMNEMMSAVEDSSGQETLAPGEIEIAVKVTVGFLLK